VATISRGDPYIKLARKTLGIFIYRGTVTKTEGKGKKEEAKNVSSGQGLGGTPKRMPLQPGFWGGTKESVLGIHERNGGIRGGKGNNLKWGKSGGGRGERKIRGEQGATMGGINDWMYLNLGPSPAYFDVG